MRTRQSGNRLERQAWRFWAGVAASASMLLLAGCRLDRSAIVWTTGVEPPLVCPGDSVRLSYNTAEGGCLGDGCPPPVEVAVEAVGSPITEGLRMHGSSSASVVGPITAPTTFTFTTTGGRYGASRDPQSHTVDVILPEREHQVPIQFGPTCVGDSLWWYDVDLSSPEFRSEGVRLVRVCNFRSEIVSLELGFSDLGSDRRWTLRPGECTEDFPPEVGTHIISANASPLFVSPVRVECTTRSSGPLPGIELQAVFTCDVMTASAPIVAASPGPTATTSGIFEIPTLTPEATVPAPEEPKATFRQNGNCRKGPGGNYDVITSILAGQQLPVEGRNADSTWWYLLLPNSTAHCWSSDAALELFGPVGGLPVIAALPTPTVLVAPAPPEKLVISNQTCSDTAYDVTIGWIDVSGNDGYRVYRDGSQIGSTGPNATSFVDSPPFGGPYTYGVESYNAGGMSARPTVVEAGCLY